LARRGDAYADPILNPKSGERHAGLAQFGEFLVCGLHAALTRDDHAVVHPVGQDAHAAGIFGVGLDQIERRLAVKNSPGHGAGPHLDLEMRCRAHIEHVGVLEEQRAQAAGDEMRRRGFVHEGVAPFAIGKDVDQLRQIGRPRPTPCSCTRIGRTLPFWLK
jgi:hypothetical protein